MLPENVYQILYDQRAYDIPFLLYKRTQASKLQDLRGGHSNGTFHLMEAGFACGSMVRFDLVHKNLHFVQIFVNKNSCFRPAGGDSPR